MKTNPLYIYEFQNLSSDTVLNEAALAELFQVCIKTIKRMEKRGDLPPHFTLGNRSFWFAGSVLAHLKKKAQLAVQELELKKSRLSKYTP